MAGIYPIGMKLIITWSKTSTSTNLALLVGIDVVKPMLDQFNIKIREFLFTSSESFNFFSVVEAENDSDVEALSAIVLSSGTWDSMHWSRAYESLEYKKIYEKAAHLLPH